MALTDKLKAIADAIRSKTGKSDGLTLDQMPAEIESISGGGGDTGLADYLSGKTDDLIDGTLDELAPYAFYINSSVRSNFRLKNIELKNATSIGTQCFNSSLIKFGDFIAPKLEKIESYSLTACKLHDVKMPGLKTLGEATFSSSEITGEVDFSNVETSGNSAFSRTLFSNGAVSLPKLLNVPSNFLAAERGVDTGVRSVYFQKARTISSYAFRSSQIEYIDTGELESITPRGVEDCPALRTIILRNTSTVCTYGNAAASFDPPLNATGELRIYVPAALIASYQTATNWARLYAANPDVFQPIEGSPYEEVSA